MGSNTLLLPSVAVNLTGHGIADQISLRDVGYGYHTPVIGVIDLYGDGSLYLIREAAATEANGLAYLQIYQVNDSSIVLYDVLRTFWTNKLLTGDLQGNGQTAIVAPSFTDNTSLEPGTVFLPNGSGGFTATTWLDYQQHGPSMGQFSADGAFYFITPAESGSNMPLGTCISWFDQTTSTIRSQQQTPLVGTASAIVPATGTSGAYLFLGQQSGSIYGGADAFIPIDLRSGLPRTDDRLPIQYENGFWTQERASFATSFESADLLNQQYPLSPNYLTQNHSVDAKTADFNGDGLPDVLVSHLYRDPQSYVYALTLYVQKAEGGFEDVTNSSFFDFDHHESGPYQIFTNDINHDGHSDIVFGEVNYAWWTQNQFPNNGPYGTANAAIYLNDGLGHFIRAATDNNLFQQFQNNQIALVPDATGSISVVSFDFFGDNDLAPLVVTLFNNADLYTGPNGSNPALQGAPGFSEWYYLNTHPDASSAVKNGSFATGLDYYLAIGAPRGDSICAPGSIIYGSSGSDLMTPDAIDIFRYQDSSSVYSINSTASSDGIFATVTRHGSGIIENTLHGISRLEFADTMVGLDVGKGGNTGEVYRLYLTVLGRNPQTDAEGCGFWIDKLDRNILTTEQMVGYFLNADEFVSRFGGTTNTNESFVNLMYLNLLGRDGHPDSGFGFWLNVLDNHLGARQQVVADFMESPENVTNAAPLIGDTPTYQQWVG